MPRTLRSLPLVAFALCCLLLPSCSLISTAIGLGISVGKVKLAFGCLPEGTAIDTPMGARLIENLQPGDSVVGFSGETVLVQQKHAYLVEASAPPFRVIRFDDGQQITLSGQHRINGTPAGEIQIGDVLDGRRVAGVSERSGVSRSFDLLTEDAGYRIGGVPVNSMIEEMAAAAVRQTVPNLRR